MWPGAWVQGGGRESPRRARYFSLLRQRKVPKRKATPSLRPLRGAKGQTCGEAVAGCAVELALRSRAPLRHPRRVRARSMGATTPMPPRNRPAAGAASRGGEPNIQTATRAIAALGPACAARGACARETGPSAAQRSNGPCGCPLPGFPSGCAWGAQGAGWHVCRRTHMLRELTHRSCSSEAPQARSEFCGAPRDRAPQVAP